MNEAALPSLPLPVGYRPMGIFSVTGPRGPLFAPDEPTGGDTPEKPETPEKGGTQDDGVGKVILAQGEYDKLKSAAERAESLKQAESLARAATKAFGKGGSEEERQEAIVTLMRAAGHTDEEIVEAIGGEEEEEGGKAPAYDPQIKQQLDELAQESRETRLEALREKHTESVEKVFREGPLATLLTDMKEGLSQKELESLQETLREDVVQSSRELLRQRRDREGKFQTSWIPEAVKQATDNVVKKARLFGGGSKIGRAGELSPAEDEFLKQPAKKLPNPLAEGDGEQALNEFVADRLSRAALESRRAEASRV